MRAGQLSGNTQPTSGNQRVPPPLRPHEYLLAFKEAVKGVSSMLEDIIPKPKSMSNTCNLSAVYLKCADDIKSVMGDHYVVIPPFGRPEACIGIVYEHGYVKG